MQNGQAPHLQLIFSLFGKGGVRTIVEAGACRGEDTVVYADLFPEARVFAFEPLPANFEMLRERTAKSSDRVQPYPFALDDMNGAAVFHVSSGIPPGAAEDAHGHLSSSLLAPQEVARNYPWLHFEEKTEVQTIRLADFAAKQELQEIDFLHLDVQGAELKVLRGAGDFLPRIKTLWLEVAETELYAGQPLRKEVEKFLKGRGFRLVYEARSALSGDQFYINKRYFPKGISKKALPASEKPRPGNQLMKRIRRKLGSLLRPKENVRQLSFSQSGEDRITLFLLRALGVSEVRYMDVGAHHPFVGSNTALFYKLGGKGVLIEPNPIRAKQLRAARPKDTVVQAAICDAAGDIIFWLMEPDTLSTTDEAEGKRLLQNGLAKSKDKASVPGVTLSHLWQKHFGTSPIHFLSIDIETEGAWLPRQIGDLSNKPWIVCLETIIYGQEPDSGTKSHVKAVMESAGYRLCADTLINSIFLRKDMWDRIKWNG